ncbi:MAG: hypothetical protein ACREOS_13750, partial [Candidatus Dormibacteraceae bacterium]
MGLFWYISKSRDANHIIATRREYVAANPTPASFMHELTVLNPWWRTSRWQEADPSLRAAARAPFQRHPPVLDDITSPNLYTLRGPRRVGKSTVLKQTIARLCT